MSGSRYIPAHFCDISENLTETRDQLTLFMEYLHVILPIIHMLQSPFTTWISESPVKLIYCHKKGFEALHKGSRHWAEIKILSYLYTHGNTREDDLTAYVIRALNKSANNVKKTLNRMAKEKKIRQIVHRKLEPQAVYFAEGDIADYDFDLWTLAGIDENGDIERYRKAIKNDLRAHLGTSKGHISSANL